MANPTFAARKAAGDLRLSVPHDADAWIAEKQRELDFKLKKLSYQARAGKLVGVRLVNGVLTIAKERTKVPKAKVEAAKWLILDRMPQIDITDLLVEVELTTNLIIAASASDDRLPMDEIDRILGVAPHGA